MNEDIRQKFLDYQDLMSREQYETIIQECIYPVDLDHFYENFFFLLEKMDAFGENEGLFRIIGLNSVEAIKGLSRVDFFSKFINGALQRLPGESRESLFSTMQIEEVESAGQEAKVHFSFQLNAAEASRYRSSTDLVLKDGVWYVRFKSEMHDGFKRLRKKLDDFYSRKAKDQLPGEENMELGLEKFELIGWRTYDGDTIIEPRFSKAGEFSEGLASARVFSKYGYIDMTGEFVIPPQFSRARDFQNGLAIVGNLDDEYETWYGLINKEGEFLTDFSYQEMHSFSEGYAAVKQRGKWGFINEKGEVSIELIYHKVTDFDDGTALLYRKKEEQYICYEIDLNGNVIDQWELDEEEFGYNIDD